MNTKADDGRIIFLDYLRAMAVLLVVLGHVYFMGYNGHDAITPYVPSVTQNIFGPDAATRNVLSGPSIWTAQRLGINVGALGVSIFFLISGFVILRSVERESVTQFAIRRIFRIYPACLAAVAFVCVVTEIYCHLTGTASPHSLYSVMVSGLVLNAYVGGFETMPVLWSLNVEIVFYVLMAALAAAGWLSSRRLVVISAVGATIAVACVRTSSQASFAALQITFLLIGSMMYRATVRTDKRRAVACVVIGWAIFAGTRYVMTQLNFQEGGADLPNGAWAIGIFVAGMALKPRAGIRLAPLRWVASVSYPLYLVHIPFAWICLAWLGSLGMGMLSAGVLTAAMILLAAWAIHMLVEKPTQRLGKVLSSRNQAIVTDAAGSVVDAPAMTDLQP